MTQDSMQSFYNHTQFSASNHQADQRCGFPLSAQSLYNNNLSQQQINAIIDKSIAQLSVISQILEQNNYSQEVFSVREKILSLNLRQSKHQQEIRNFFQYQEGIDYSKYALNESRLTGGRNRNKKLTLYPTQITKKIFDCILGQLPIDNPQPIIIQGDIGSGKSTAPLMFLFLTENIMNLQIQGLQKGRIPENLLSLLNRIPKVIILSLDKPITQLFQSIQSQCSQLQGYHLPKDSLRKYCLSIFSVYKSKGIRTYFFIDKGNEYFAAIREAIPMKQLKSQNYLKKLAKINHMAEILLACCSLSSSKDSATFILSSNTLELNILKIHSMYYNFMKDGPLPESIISMNYSSFISNVQGQTELKLIAIFQIERLLRDCLKQNIKNREKIIQVAGRQFRTFFLKKQMKFEFYTSFLRVRQYVKVNEAAIEKLIDNCNDQVQHHSQQQLRNNIQEFLKKQTKSLKYYGLEKETQGIQKFINKSINELEKHIRVMIIEYFKKSAKKAGTMRPTERYFDVSIEQLVGTYVQFMKIDNYTSCSLSILQKLQSQYIYNNFIEKNGFENFRVFIQPELYCKITEFIRPQVVEFVKNVQLEDKPFIRKNIIGTNFQDTMLKIFQTPNLKMTFSTIRKFIQIKNKKISYFTHFHSELSYVMTNHFGGAMQELDQMKLNSYITCLPMTVQGYFASNSPSFDCAFIKKTADKQYQIITIDLTLSERTDVYLSLKNNKNTKAQKAANIIKKINQNKEHCKWKNSPINFIITHWIICPKIIYGKISHLTSRLKMEYISYQNIHFIPYVSINFVSKLDQLLVSQFNAYSSQRQKEANIFIEESIQQPNDDYSEQSPPEIKGEQRDTAQLPEQVAYNEVKNEPKIADVLQQKEKREKKPCVRKKNRQDDQYKYISKKESNIEHSRQRSRQMMTRRRSKVNE